MANTNLSKAKSAKNDEFYTQYADIQKEVNAYLDYDANVFRGKTVLLPCDDPEWSNFTKFFAQNFERFGLKRLISTSYATESKNVKHVYQPTLFESAAPQFDKKKTRVRGKIFVLDHDTNRNGRIDIKDLEWDYLKGDGDFRSDEVKKLRDEADIIVTNPPFSLFREFLAWIVEADKKFLILGNKNALKYKEVFPLIKGDRIWCGATSMSKEIYFEVPQEFIDAGLRANKDRTIVVQEGRFVARSPSIWFSNMEHGRRHQPLILLSERENIKFSKHKEVRGIGYLKYVNFDAIEVPFSDAIPSDYEGIMGVPISFMDKYCPEQFEIVGMSLDLGDMDIIRNRLGRNDGGPTFYVERDGQLVRLYDRIAIRHKRTAVSACVDEGGEGAEMKGDGK